ncbi:MAG: polyamine aminopropyltransferase [Nitrospirota bacterium]|nr:MAG: polyamine aminopropyltransferase [Nitrospirota bacterium]
MLNSRWFLEFTTKDEGSIQSLIEVIHSSNTEFQRLEILKLGSFGKCLILDGKIQSTEADEFIYHETLVQPAIMSMERPEKVLIAGGGEGATIREVLRHGSIKEVTLVDLDREVVESCKRYMPEWHNGVFDDPRVKVVYDDARKYIESSDEVFDLIVLDLPEPFDSGPVQLLYTKEFYSIISGKLTTSGCLVTQATSSAVHNCSAFKIIGRTAGEVFPVIRPYTVNIPSFYSPWGFIFASNATDPVKVQKKELENKIRKVEGLSYYNSDIHYSLFSLPTFLQKGFKEESRINTDDDPISFY